MRSAAITTRSAFELAYARWRGEPIAIGPAKAAPSSADELDRAFTEWECAPTEVRARS